jgi:hypothetical protein
MTADDGAPCAGRSTTERRDGSGNM